jgi:hypothetical protein
VPAQNLRGWPRIMIICDLLGSSRHILGHNMMSAFEGLACKALFCERTKLFRGTGVLIRIYVGRHIIKPFPTSDFVCSLQGIRLPNTGFDGRAAKFCRRLILEFCDTIGWAPTRNGAFHPNDVSQPKSDPSRSRLGPQLDVDTFFQNVGEFQTDPIADDVPDNLLCAGTAWLSPIH